MTDKEAIENVNRLFGELGSALAELSERCIRIESPVFLCVPEIQNIVPCAVYRPVHHGFVRVIEERFLDEPR